MVSASWHCPHHGPAADCVRLPGPLQGAIDGKEKVGLKMNLPKDRLAAVSSPPVLPRRQGLRSGAATLAGSRDGVPWARRTSWTAVNSDAGLAQRQSQPPALPTTAACPRKKLDPPTRLPACPCGPPPPTQVSALLPAERSPTVSHLVDSDFLAVSDACMDFLAARRRARDPHAWPGGRAGRHGRAVSQGCSAPVLHNPCRAARSTRARREARLCRAIQARRGAPFLCHCSPGLHALLPPFHLNFRLRWCLMSGRLGSSSLPASGWAPPAFSGVQGRAG